MAQQNDALKFFRFIKCCDNSFSIVDGINRLQSITRIVVSVSNVNRDKDKNKYALVYLDDFDVFRLAQAINSWDAVANNQVIFRSVKGGTNKKFGGPVSRCLYVTVNDFGDFVFTVEIKRGEQEYVTKKTGERVPGKVKPGKEVLVKCDIVLNREEALFIAYSLQREMAAWRNAINYDVIYAPDKYEAKNNEASDDDYQPLSFID